MTGSPKQRRQWLAVLGLLSLMLGSGCAREARTGTTADAEYPSPFETVAAPTATSPTQLADRVVLVSNARLEEIRRRMRERIEPTTAAGVRLAVEVEELREHQPDPPEEFFVPRAKDDRVGRITSVAKIREDSGAAYTFALWYQVTGDEEFAGRAAAIIMAWVREVGTYSSEASSKLGFSIFFPYFIFAADLIDDSSTFSAADQQEFSLFLRNQAVHLTETDRFHNNRADWGLALEVACAAFLQDEALLDQGFERWRAFADEQFASDGTLNKEVVRNVPTGSKGIHYSHVALKALTLAAEILRLNGRDVYSYRTASGSSLEQTYQKITGWVREPATFEHFKGEKLDELVGIGNLDYWEILHSRWPRQLDQALILVVRPVEDHLSFTHGSMPPEL